MFEQIKKKTNENIVIVILLSFSFFGYSQKITKRSYNKTKTGL
jgi:hypothetical protein